MTFLNRFVNFYLNCSQIPAKPNPIRLQESNQYERYECMEMRTAQTPKTVERNAALNLYD